jgi:hypothetical protein
LREYFTPESRSFPIDVFAFGTIKAQGLPVDCNALGGAMDLFEEVFGPTRRSMQLWSPKRCSLVCEQSVRLQVSYRKREWREMLEWGGGTRASYTWRISRAAGGERVMTAAEIAIQDLNTDFG